VIVVDASAVLDGLLDPEGHPDIAAVLVGAEEPVAAPDLLDVEVLHVLRRWEHRRQITAARASQALDDLQALPIVHHPARATIALVWAMRRTLSAYDAQYVALAKALQATLLTTDRRMANAARQLRVLVA
jgi:predicted nucleic acid-binding protein